MSSGTDRAERQILDELEDAREEHQHYRRVIAALLVIAAVGVALIVGGAAIGIVSSGAGIDRGGLAGALVIPGVFIALGFGGGAGAHMADTRGKVTKRLRKAERAHRDYFLDQP